MTFRKRLLVAFATVIVIPMILFMVAFVALGNYLLGEGRELQGYTSIVGNYDDYDEEAEAIFQSAAGRMDALQDVRVLDDLSSRIRSRNLYIAVRRGKKLYYTSNQALAEADLDRLPAFDKDAVGETGGSSFIQGRGRSLMVRRIDFYFPDGEEGTFFLVTRVTGLISGRFMSGLFVSMLTILIFTAFLLTRWLETSIFTPISAINIAMNNIRDGNFTYTLSTGEEGEIGELYRNYEDMRLRLKESADEKLEHERQNRELISNISHDLKTPITSIKGYVEGLIDGVANTPEKQAKYIRTIYNKANDMDHLIDELTLYSRFESDRIPYNFHRLSVGDYFGDCVEEIGMDLESKGIELNYTNLVSPQTKIIADPEQMKRVINNIVGNSVKYMDKEKGRIDIRILDEHDSVRIEVEDNGKGIAARDLPNIFDRFYRTDSSRNSSQGGSGIGLSIVRKIVEDHGGYIWATSREGEGTCMHMVIRKYLEQETDSVDTMDPVEEEII
ncbi:MAG: HAMP domain-containing histidine kinase [Lachnospiraceae bacterium]|nr:HAMP domain-containing histidine kinase [Lachnospiraceae bacterium]